MTVSMYVIRHVSGASADMRAARPARLRRTPGFSRAGGESGEAAIAVPGTVHSGAGGRPIDAEPGWPPHGDQQV